MENIPQAKSFPMRDVFDTGRPPPPRLATAGRHAGGQNLPGACGSKRPRV